MQRQFCRTGFLKSIGIGNDDYQSCGVFPCKESKCIRTSAWKRKDKESIVEAYKIII